MAKTCTTNQSPGPSIDWTDPDHGVGVLHEEVEDEGDEADEGQDGDTYHLFLVSSIEFILCYALNIVPQLPENIPQLHHVLRDGVEVLQGAVDVAGALLHVQGVVQDDLVTDDDTR